MFIPFDEETLTVRSGIRDLIERVLLPESLVPGPFDADPSAKARAHRAFQESVRGAALEVPLSLTDESGGYRFEISGRADMIEDLPGGARRVTEVKTTGEVPPADRSGIPAAFVMQLYFYARALAGGPPSGSGVSMRLVVLPCSRDDPPPVEYELDASAPGLEEQWRAMLGTAAGLLSIWRDRRSRQLARLASGGVFPYRDRRPGQERLELLSEEAAANSGRVLVEAPTGTGKTAAILSGALAAAIPPSCRVFFLTSKNTQRRICLETIRGMRDAGLDLAVTVMDSRERMCAAGNARCRASECGFAESFGSRVRDSGILESLMEKGLVEPADLKAEAAAAGVCPFELQLARARHCDLVVGDYNYAFDPSVRLRRFFDDPPEEARSVLLVDEAANLPSRAREYYSPGISSALVDAAFPLPKRFGSFRRLLGGLRGSLERLGSDPALAGGGEIEIDPATDLCLRPEAWAEKFAKLEIPPSDELIDVFFAVSAMAKVSALAGGGFHLLCRKDGGGTTVQWFCTDASRFTGERFASSRASVCFSATLMPLEHHRDLLGLGEESVMESLPWPFPENSLSVWVDGYVDTRYRARARSMPMLVKRISGLVATMPGTWVLFFPSYGYMDAAARALGQVSDALLVQRPGMDQQSRDSFMAELEKGGKLVLTVSGGIFSEGVDLRAPDLRGAAVVGPSLPSVDLRSDLLRADFSASGRDGFRCASVIPGMSRVIQAAGRLVRKPGDRAVLLLLDGRFLSPPYSDLLPAHWLRDGRPRRASWSMREIREFWE